MIGYLVVHSQFFPACVLFTIAGITDLVSLIFINCYIKTPIFLQLDGLIARNFESQKSLLGSVLDPVADKLLVSTLFVTLSCVDLIPGLFGII